MKNQKDFSNKALKREDNKHTLNKIIKTNDLFTLQIEDIQKKYELTKLERSNLNQMILHYKNLNKLFLNIMK